MTRALLPFEGGVADGLLLPVSLMEASGQPPGEVLVEHPLRGDTVYKGDPDRGAYRAEVTYWPKGVGTPPPGFGRRRRR